MLAARVGAQAQKFKKWFTGGLERKASLAVPDAALLDLFGVAPVASGITVTPRTAMTCAPVRCAVQAIAEAIGQLAVHVYRRGQDGAKERAPDHPIYALLHDQANEWTSANDLREKVTRDALLRPNGGFAYINRVDGRPFELVHIDPELTPIAVGSVNGEPTYEISEGTERRQIPRADILHIPSPSLRGCGLVHDAREAIGLALIMERHAATLFGNGARPSGLITFPNNLTPEGAGKAKAAWQAAHGGKNSGGTAVLDNGAGWTPLTLNSVDSQFLELRKFAIEEIARVFRVPPIFLMEYGRATWANSEEMGSQFLTYTLMPWIKRWEGEIRLKLFAAGERDTYFTEFLTDDLLRADLGKRADAYTKLIAARVLNPNEARAAENRPPYAGGERFENPNTTPGSPQ